MRVKQRGKGKAVACLEKKKNACRQRRREVRKTIHKKGRKGLALNSEGNSDSPFSSQKSREPTTAG